MKIVNMKSDTDDSVSEYKPPTYPGSLCLYLDEDQCEALGISKALTPGTQLTLSALALVVSATESLERDGDDAGNDVSLSIQITDLGIEVSGTARNAAAELYGGAQ